MDSWKFAFTNLLRFSEIDIILLSRFTNRALYFGIDDCLISIKTNAFLNFSELLFDNSFVFYDHDNKTKNIQ